jgi:hypothetical protein
MKTILALVAAALLATTAVTQAASTSESSQHTARTGWSSRVHVYGADHYTPWYDSYGNNNMNPDFQLVH